MQLAVTTGIAHPHGFSANGIHSGLKDVMLQTPHMCCKAVNADTVMERKGNSRLVTWLGT